MAGREVGVIRIGRPGCALKSDPNPGRARVQTATSRVILDHETNMGNVTLFLAHLMHAIVAMELD